MGVVMIYFYSKRFRFAPSFNDAKIYRNSRKLNQSINGCSYDLLYSKRFRFAPSFNDRNINRESPVV